MVKLKLVIAVCAACFSAPLAGQTGKIAIGVTPRSGQQIHYAVTDEFSIDTASEGGTTENQPPKRSTTFAGGRSLAYSLLMGRADPQGHSTGQMILERGITEIRYDDAPAQQQDSLRGDIGGKTFTIVFGAGGEVIGFTNAELREQTLTEIKSWSAEVDTYFPTVALSVGETVTQPAIHGVPVTLLPNGPFNVDGRVTMTLVARHDDTRPSQRAGRCRSWRREIEPDGDDVRPHGHADERIDADYYDARCPEGDRDRTALTRVPIPQYLL